MQYIFREFRETKEGAVHIYRGLKGCAANWLEMILFGWVVVIMCLVLIGGFMAAISVSTPDGYGYVKNSHCEVINFKNWCTYDIGIFDTPYECTLERSERMYKISDKIPLNLIAINVCNVWECGGTCVRRTAGNIMLYVAAAMSGTLILYCFLGYMRKPDEIQEQCTTDVEGTSTPSAPSEAEMQTSEGIV